MSGDAAPPDGAAQIASFVFAVLLIDPAGRVVEANSAAEEMVGRSLARMRGLPFESIVAFEEPRVMRRAISGDTQLVARGISMRVGERDLRINLTASPMRDHPGYRALTLSDAGQASGNGNPIETSLRAPSVLAHEIKNPLAAIRGASQLLSRRVTDQDRPLSDLILAEVDRIAGLIDRMQQLGSRQAVAAGPCNLHEAIRNAMATVRAGRGDGVELVEEFDPSLPAVAADQALLEQALINLFANACDASTGLEAPRVVVRTRFASGLKLSSPGPEPAVPLPIEITVSDAGPGVEPGLRDHIFEPFVTTKAHGQGLGLALVRKLVADMGGRVVHERDERAGLTHFRLNLPLPAKDPA